jgi:hypothetical protein
MNDLARIRSLLGRTTALAAVLLLAATVAHSPVLAGHRTHAHSSPWFDSDHGPGDRDGFGWAIFDGKLQSRAGSVDKHRWDAFQDLFERNHRPLVWFRLDGQEWIIQDPALVARARGSVEPMERLGREMGRLGGEMGQLGAQQGRFGAEMGRLGARQGALAARLALLELRGEDDPAAEREADAIEREMDELSRRQDAFEGRHDSSVEGRMEDLGEKMDELGERMEQLSRRAERELRALAKEAIASRRAERFAGRGER